MSPIVLAIIIQAALSGLFLLAGYIWGKSVEARRGDERDRAFKLTDMLLDQRAREAESADFDPYGNVIELRRVK